MSSSSSRIPYVNLQAQWQEERDNLLPIIDKVLESGQYVGGEELDKFEENIAKLCCVKYAAALNSGTDALIFALHINDIGKGDEVITPPNSFIASAAAIVRVGAKPVFVDVLPDQNLDPSRIEDAITKKTKAIMPVHLTGRVCDMDPIMEIAKRHNLVVIEDAAQAIGSKYKGQHSGSIGNIGCFSTHPLKNLNACGDGGFITTNDENIYNQSKTLRNHGIVNRNIVHHFGTVSRMDNLQAAILNYRLAKLDNITKKRRSNAKVYFDGINVNGVFIPEEKTDEYNTYHTFVVQTEHRDELKKYLSLNDIDTAIHYPVPIHLQPASKKLGYKAGDFPITEKQSKEILTLPVNQYLTEVQLERIISVVNQFQKEFYQ
jgi:dTDP-4-amino-4,6-dideoxygalactose transaminase